MPCTNKVKIFALRSIPIKNRKIPPKRLDVQCWTNREVLNEVLWRVLQLLTFKQNPSAKSGHYNDLCADGNFRHCKPVLAAWLPDCPKHSNQHHREWHVCFRCECSQNELGDYLPPDKQHPRQDHNLYRTLSDANSKAANAELLSRQVHQGFNVFRHIPCSVSDLSNPNLPHTIHIGILDHLQKWIFHSNKTHERLNKYNAIWLFVPAYHDCTLKNKSYQHVSQWNGKDINQMSLNLIGVETQTLRGGSTAQDPIFNHPIECTGPFFDIYMYSHYQSHDNAILSYMMDTLNHFHTFKDVLLLRRACEMVKPTPIPWERKSWTMEWLARKYLLRLGCGPRSGTKWTPGGILPVTW